MARSGRARLPLVARTLLWAFSGDALSRVAVLATSLIAVRALSPVEFGIYLGLSATTVLAASFWDAGASSVLTREVAAKRLGDREGIRQTLLLRLRALPLAVATFAIGALILARDFEVTELTLFAFAMSTVAISLHTITLAVLRAHLRFKEAAGALSFGRWATAVISLAAIPATGPGDALLLLASALFAGELVTLVFSILVLVRSSGHATAQAHAAASKITFRAALPFAANSVLNLAYNRFDVVVLGALSTADQLADYAPASRIQDALYLVPFSIGSVAFPVIARQWRGSRVGSDTRALVVRLMALGVAISVPVAALVFLFAEELVTTVLGDDYAGAVTATKILVWFLPFAALASPLLAALGATDRATDTTRCFLIAFLVAMTMHASLDWWWGATGAAVASLSREPAILIAAAFYARRANIIGRRSALADSLGAGHDAVAGLTDEHIASEGGSRGRG